MGILSHKMVSVYNLRRILPVLSKNLCFVQTPKFAFQHSFIQMSGELKPLEDQVSIPISSTKSMDNVEIEPLSGKPFFHVRMLRSHVTRQYQLVIPAKFTRTLPYKTIPVILIRGGRSWETSYHGNHLTNRRLDTKWKLFVVDNKLKVGDICVFELMECEDTLLKFKVQILRSDFPSVLLEKQVGTRNNPVVIDDD
ncbi:B3 domain-containing protein Os06g0112300-like [Silene latifolia]|uniref:B3 domain-containing protein Os06g0112300-like n=1 Tax=Silene latifolia TaxID=37657 RepID=UPI003D77D330